MRPKLAEIAAAALLFMTAACGSPGYNDVCNARCDALLRCQYDTAKDADLCHSDCNQTKGTSADLDAQLAKDCKNAGEIRTQQLQCYTAACMSSQPTFEMSVASCIDTAQSSKCQKP